jgi:hypothetical protein
MTPTFVKFDAGPPMIEAEFQLARRRDKCSREDFYAGFIAALRVRRIMHVAGELIDEFDREFVDEGQAA